MAWGCVAEPAESEAQRRRGDGLVWTFGDGAGPASLVLWPAGKEAPPRMKRHLRTSQSGELLRAQVSGVDPGFVWQLPGPLFAGAFHVTVQFEHPGSLQLFWAGKTCRSFDERCSERARVPAGRTSQSFLLPAEPLSELRLDFEERAGQRFEIERMELRDQAAATGGWAAPDLRTNANVVEGALEVTADHGDPWVAADVPQLAADDVDTLELFLSGPDGASTQVFWRGTECPHFEERCSAVLGDVTSRTMTGSWTHVGDHPAWKGRIDGLRVDPGAVPGQYRIDRIALLCASALGPRRPK